MHRNFKARIARSPRGSEHAAQSQLFAPSAVPLEIRAPDFLRPRSERDHLLDDANGNGAIDPSRILDDRIERQRPQLQIVEDGADEFPGNEVRVRPAKLASMENFLSVGRYQALSTKTAAWIAKVHDHRPMVLERSRRSGRTISRSLEEVRVRAVPRSSEACAEGEV